MCISRGSNYELVTWSSYAVPPVRTKLVSMVDLIRVSPLIISIRQILQCRCRLNFGSSHRPKHSYPYKTLQVLGVNVQRSRTDDLLLTTAGSDPGSIVVLLVCTGSVTVVDPAIVHVMHIADRHPICTPCICIALRFPPIPSRYILQLDTACFKLPRRNTSSCRAESTEKNYLVLTRILARGGCLGIWQTSRLMLYSFLRI
jgi:hypothetical protein